MGRAYFCAVAMRNLFIQLPVEDKDHSADLVGKLRLNFYGTPDGATNWQDHLSKHIVGLGFTRGVGHPSVFLHPVKRVMCLVHCDDYVRAGDPENLAWVEEKLRAEYDPKTQMLGPNALPAGKVLNRMVRWSRDGWELEADPRHAELIIEQLGVKSGGGITTAGAQQAEPATDEASDEAVGKGVTLFRGLAARCNYLALDRPDLQYAAKEVCREMSKPSVQSLAKLRRIGQYLYGKPRLVGRFEYQGPQTTIDIYVDANRAACRRTRKSTSGGCAMVGSHCIETSAKTQATIAKSSAGSQLHGVIRGSTEGLGLIALGGDFGTVFEAQVHVDASAAIGIVERQCLQKIRHIEVDLLWIQEMELMRLLPLPKILGSLHPADIITEDVPIETVMTFTKLFRLTSDTGRAGAAAQLHVIAAPSDEAREDEWIAQGEQRVWIRNHNHWRRELFTPEGVSGGPDAGVKLKTTRITTGVTEDGCRFQISDNWRDLDSSHRRLDSRLGGTTAFEQKYTNGAPAAQTRVVIDSVLQQTVTGGTFMGILTRVDKGIGEV